MQSESNHSGFSGSDSASPQEPIDAPDGALVIGNIRAALTENVGQHFQKGRSLITQHDEALQQIAQYVAEETSIPTGQAKLAVYLQQELTGKKTAAQGSAFNLHNCLVFELPKPSVHCHAAQLPSNQPIALKSATV